MVGDRRRAGVPEAKQVPALRGFPLKRHDVPVGGRIYSLVLPDAQQWRREGEWVGAVLAGAEPPYWSRLWPAAIDVARLLARARGLSGVRVLDLGCGLGLPGIVAGSLGAHVTFVDRCESALAFASWNAATNVADGAFVTTQIVDWERADVEGVFDVIVLADVSYHASNHVPLLRQLGRCLAPGGLVVHGDPMRAESTSFLRHLSSSFVVLPLTPACTPDKVSRQPSGTGLPDSTTPPRRLVLAAADAAAITPWLERLRQVVGTA
jgi:predicted nicotinamide N-methyase